MSKLFEEAKKYMPGGVNSPVRAFKAVGGEPVFFKKGMGSRIYDVDGKEYIDYVLSWGPLILGHSHPDVVSALKQQSEKGTSFGAPTGLEVALAKMIIEAIPGMEKVRMVNSGTEATMSAIRLARGYTGRDIVVKMEGCYHGHADSLLVKAGSGVLTLGIPGSSGIPASIAGKTIVARYNSVDSIKDIFEAYGNEIACLIVEPVPGNMGVILPKKGYLESLRELTGKHGIVLIFDEVMSGFRVSYSGAQGFYGIKPDLTTLGKVIGGGLPVGAFGGRAGIMSKIAPEGPVYQAGTLSGNPLAMTAGIETLKALQKPGTYDYLESISAKIADGLKSAAEKHGVPVTLNRIGSMMTLFFTGEDVFDYESATLSDTMKYSKFFHKMLERGINLPPSQFEAFFVSTVHTEEDMVRTIAAADDCFRELH
ncbi:MAG: glutamate-1-semialdehyde 2,1-aminomutase [Acidobacteriota bacterium]